MVDLAEILAAKDAFALSRISKTIRSGRGIYPVLKPLLVYEDNHLLTVFKPPGWLSQPDATNDLSVNEIFAAYLKEKYEKPGKVFCAAVHRLDRPASGFMVLARTSKAAARLSEEIRTQAFLKRYFVLTQKPLLAMGRISKKITLMADMQKIGRIAKRATGRAAPLGNEGAGEKYYVLTAELKHQDKTCFGYSVTIEGGKFHQIRALFAAYNAPIWGDVKYGGPALPKFRDRIALVCNHLLFNHPTQEKKLLFYLPEPDLARLPQYFI